MKKITIAIVLCMTGVALMAQPVFEKTYSESATIGHLESAGEVYYSMDVVNKQCLIYMMDHTLWKTIPLPTPEGYYLSDVQYVSEKLFNDDNLVELIYIYSKYVPTETSYYYTFETKLINENGTAILTIPGAGHTSVMETMEDGRKFLVYEYDYSVIPYRTYTHVYSLPEPAVKSGDVAVQASGMAPPYPNPAHSQIIIPVTLPGGVDSGSLEVFDLNGKRVLSHSFRGSSGNVELPTHQLVPGSYIYHVEAGGIRSAARKFVIR